MSWFAHAISPSLCLSPLHPPTPLNCAPQKCLVPWRPGASFRSVEFQTVLRHHVVAEIGIQEPYFQLGLYPFYLYRL